MKVYFDETPTGLARYGEIYQLIGKVIENLGHQLTSRWILDFDKSFFNLPRDKWKKHYQKIVRDLLRADMAVFEISQSSTTIGQLIQQALISKKPIITLKEQGVVDNVFLVGAWIRTCGRQSTTWTTGWNLVLP